MAIIRKCHEIRGRMPRTEEPVPNRANEVDGIDRLSSLPNEILCHILSFLPTKYAVGTGILSTQWKDLLPLVHNLRIVLDDTERIVPESDADWNPTSFKDFVDRLLYVTLRGSPLKPSVESFNLRCCNFDDGQKISRWIEAALDLKVKKMDLCIHPDVDPEYFIHSLFGANIVSLNLQLDYGVNPDEFRFSLPNLEELSLTRFNAVNALIECCPKLKVLVLDHCYVPHNSFVRVFVPNLTLLKVYNTLPQHIGGFELRTPNLEHFLFKGLVPNYVNVKEKLDCLIGARLDLNPYNEPHHYNEFNERAFTLIKACTNAVNLSLSGEVVRMLARSARPLPRFPKLSSLLIPNIDAFGWTLLPTFLNCADKLMNLYLEIPCGNGRFKVFIAYLDGSVSVVRVGGPQRHDGI
ncbi:F-box/LRR-repeat protein At4g14103-like [Andrographis paniculata]|uniref:F-box/LRR-repeat protein At4g14103-like n=1 Tax=Andrographis paniculata TaxID=175694 RepID=UPI0021E8F2F9|nr:F-box/LRR-repeat protein At4g14103-like [Andrographis paniculata]XP_051119912.1 F-box/LRR-repeat protein At4g14103-like [Andrographis paniculata]XP_051119913.1 F-box/LRR-repeat protein At4g14103-like [Andrographis paniculata]XP_051119914.1 F-box/LRR-repeat protein At4g14103-like [Andrographis paniculata]